MNDCERASQVAQERGGTGGISDGQICLAFFSSVSIPFFTHSWQLHESVVNAACTGATTEEGAAPYGKKLNARRLEFIGQIRASLVKYGGNGRLLFRDLMQKRKAGRLADDEKWIRWECTFFGEDKERLFQRFLDKNVTGV